MPVVPAEDQTKEFEFAYLVTTAATASVGLLGTGIVNSGSPGGARWGLDGDAALPIPFVVPEPGSWGLLFAALLGFLLMGLRRRNEPCVDRFHAHL